MKRPGLLNADTVGCLTDCESLSCAAALSLQDNAFENLNSFAVTFLDLSVYADRVADAEICDAFLKLGLFNLLDDFVHI